ncbi:MAG TPA: hypothetical protein VFW23_04950 [Tepidisphaeraceae bacterium]|nr:hypothetical protein [Tepidisphaeraceae bacterium]
MLRPHQVLPFLLHDDQIVREHARRYFHESYDVGPLTADHYWEVIDRFGQNNQTLGFASDLDDLPQTDASLGRLLQALSPNTPELFEFHYQHVARNVDMPILSRHRGELLPCKQLLPHVRKHLETRLRLLDEPSEQAWDQLMRHGQELRDQYAFSFDASPSDALIEAAARGGELICEQAMRTLDDESAADDWRDLSRRLAPSWKSWRSTRTCSAKKPIARCRESEPKRSSIASSSFIRISPGTCDSMRTRRFTTSSVPKAKQVC